MARISHKNVFTTLVLAIIVLSDVNGLPTSVLVDSKQQGDATNDANSKGKDTTVAKDNKTPSDTTLERTSNNANRDHQKLHAQKRGVKQNFYDRDLSKDILVNNNNLPNGIWDDSDVNVYYPDLPDMDDFQPFQSYQQYSGRMKPYENLQQLLQQNLDNSYDEPLALPVKYQYPRYLADDRRKRATANKDPFKLERETNKMGLSTADMLGLLALLETDERNINSNNRPISDIDDLNLALYYRMLLGGNANPLKDDTTNEGEWLNGLVEPSVQYYGRMEPSPRDRRPYTGDFPSKRYMISKKKRSLGINKSEHFFDVPSKSKMTSGFDSRYRSTQL